LQYLVWRAAFSSILEGHALIDLKESPSHEIECLLLNYNSTTDFETISAQLLLLPRGRTMNYQAGSSSIASSSIYATETDSISPLLVRNVDLPSGRSISILIYKPDQSGVKDPDEIVMISAPVVPSESASDEATR
jgi:hypothetical protein